MVRQAQVLIERYVGSSLAPGTISHLNYAQKVGQVPMVLALVLTTVTFPALARTMAAGDESGSRRRVRLGPAHGLDAWCCWPSAYLFAYAPQVVAVLFEHGEFTAADTAATAGHPAGLPARPARARVRRGAVPAVLLGRAADLVPGGRDGGRPGP